MKRMLRLGSDANGEERRGGFPHSRVRRMKWGWFMFGSPQKIHGQGVFVSFFHLLIDLSLSLLLLFHYFD